jgi:hypothetical protein
MDGRVLAAQENCDKSRGLMLAGRDIFNPYRGLSRLALDAGK